MPWTSAVRDSGSTSSTRWNPDTSRPGALEGSRQRKRLEVRLASRTGAPGGIASYDLRSASTARW